MNSNEFVQLEWIKSQFTKLRYSLDELKLKLLQKDGFWIFQWHTYSQEELLKDKVFKDIYAHIGSLSSNIQSWQSYQSVSDEFVSVYFNERTNLENRINELRDEIIERKPTGWEQFTSGFSGLFQFIFSKLPSIVRGCISKGTDFLMIDKM